MLGSDDKAGVATIMDMAYYLQTHAEVKHGTIKILFFCSSFNAISWVEKFQFDTWPLLDE